MVCRSLLVLSEERWGGIHVFVLGRQGSEHDTSQGGYLRRWCYGLQLLCFWDLLEVITPKRAARAARISLRAARSCVPSRCSKNEQTGFELRDSHHLGDPPVDDVHEAAAGWNGNALEVIDEELGIGTSREYCERLDEGCARTRRDSSATAEPALRDEGSTCESMKHRLCAHPRLDPSDVALRASERFDAHRDDVERKRVDLAERSWKLFGEPHHLRSRIGLDERRVASGTRVKGTKYEHSLVFIA